MFSSQRPTASISVDVGWSPDNIDGRYYDIPGLTAAADFLYVMDYDVRSQVIDRCLAGANSPIGAATLGLSKWLQVRHHCPSKLRGLIGMIVEGAWDAIASVAFRRASRRRS